MTDPMRFEHWQSLNHKLLVPDIALHLCDLVLVMALDPMRFSPICEYSKFGPNFWYIDSDQLVDIR